MTTTLGRVMLGLAAALAALAAILVLRPSLVAGLWPLPGTGDLSFLFLGSILAAAAASIAWAVVEGEEMSLAGVGIDAAVTFWPMGLGLLLLDPATGGGLSVMAVVALIAAGGGTLLVARTIRAPRRDPRPSPRLVRIAFVGFVVLLLGAAIALIAGRPNSLPWSVSREMGAVAGVIFLGSAAYFGFGLVRPAWSNAGGQLAGFLVYDLVLIPALAGRAGAVPGYWRDSLWAYLAVLVGSLLVAAWYVLVDPRTRLGTHRAADRP